MNRPGLTAVLLAAALAAAAASARAGEPGRPPDAQPPVAAPARPPLAVEGLVLTSDRWVDVSGPAEFARSVFRLERCRDQQEEAEALFRWMQRCVAPGPPAYEARPSRSYVLDAGRIIRVHGYSTCDGIGTSFAQIWRSLGRDAHKAYLPARGHTVAELEYRDRDGRTRWHLFDAHGGWYALTPEGRVAGSAELAASPELVPLRGAWAGYCTIGTVHTMMMAASRWDAGLALHPQESVELLWDGGGRCYFRPDTLTSDSRKEFFKEGSAFRKQAGAAHFVYRPDFGSCAPAEACLASGARVEQGGAVANAAAGAPAVLEFAFPSPYVYTGGSAAAEVDCAAAGDSAALLARAGGRRGGWVEVAKHSGPGKAALKADLAAGGPVDAAGRYEFDLRLELRSGRPGGARLTGLRVERWAQLNARALPPVLPGWNRFALRGGRPAAGWAPRVTLAWEGRDGEEFESRTPRELPFEFQVFGARRRVVEPPIVMRRIRVECVRAPEAAVEAARGAAGATESETAERLLAVARAGGGESLGKLRAALADRDPAARQWAAHSLAVLGDKSAVPDLTRALAGDESEKVRLAAANALGMLRAPEAVPALVAALDEKAYAGLDKRQEMPFGWLRPVRWAAARSLAEIGDERAVEPLIAQMRRAQNDYLAVLAESLARLRARQALPEMCRRLQGRPRDSGARACAEAIGELADPARPGPEATAALLAGLRGSDVSVRRAAIVALGRLRVGEAVGPLRELAADAAADPYLRQAAEGALAAIAGAGAAGAEPKQGGGE